jgi:2-hydroxychromene-2-carboxylate isomerase
METRNFHDQDRSNSGLTFGSPAAYLAWTQTAEARAADTGATVPLPMLLGGVFQATGNHSRPSGAAKGSLPVHRL